MRYDGVNLYMAGMFEDFEEYSECKFLYALIKAFQNSKVAF